MKITIELPDTTICAFVSHVYTDERGLQMGCKSLDTDAIKSAKEKEAVPEDDCLTKNS